MLEEIRVFFKMMTDLHKTFNTSEDQKGAEEELCKPFQLLFFFSILYLNLHENRRVSLFFALSLKNHKDIVMWPWSTF